MGYKCKKCGNVFYFLHVLQSHICIPMKTKGENDVVNEPAHYHKNGIDVLGFAEKQFNKEELKGFHRINIIKYVTRYDKKNGVEDLKKAQRYLQLLIELESEQND